MLFIGFLTWDMAGRTVHVDAYKVVGAHCADSDCNIFYIALTGGTHRTYMHVRVWDEVPFAPTAIVHYTPRGALAAWVTQHGAYKTK